MGEELTGGTANHPLENYDYFYLIRWFFTLPLMGEMLNEMEMEVDRWGTQTWQVAQQAILWKVMTFFSF